MCVQFDHRNHPCRLALTRKMDRSDVANMPNNPRFAPNRLRRVELLAFSQVQLLDVTGPLQVFATANDIVGPAGPAYVLHVVSQAGGAVASSSGGELMTEPLPQNVADADTLLVAGGRAWKRPQPTQCSWIGSAVELAERGALRPCAPGPCCWQLRGCWMGAGLPPTGHYAPNWPGAFPPYGSSPIPFSSRTGQPGRRPVSRQGSTWRWLWWKKT